MSRGSSWSTRKCSQRIQRAIEAVEPWGVLVAILGLAFALHEFWLERDVRKATLLVMVAERLEAARAADKANRGKSFPCAYIEANARVGQIPVLETAVRSGLSLRNMDLSEIFLRGDQLHGADLRGANMTCAILAGASLAYSNLKDAIPQGVKFYDADLFCVDFTDAGVAQSRFWGGTLEQANFTLANLWETHFRGVELRGADFTDARFRDTRFENVDLRKVEGLTQAQLKRACGENVLLPSGYSIEPCAAKVPQLIEKCKFRFTSPADG